MQKKVAVIGAGLGGLAVAARLAYAGFLVDVYEANNAVGGKAGLLKKDEFRFDTGPSLITMPFVFENLFTDVGEKIEDHLVLKKLDILTKYFYPDKTILNAYSDIEKFAVELGEKTDENPLRLIKYLKNCERIYNITSRVFLEKPLDELSTYANLHTLKSILQLWKIDALRTMNRTHKRFFTDTKVQQIFNRYATYNGSSPYKAPATLNIIAHVENTLGGFYCEGGVYEIPKALERLCMKKGVRFHFNTKVDRIAINRNKLQGIYVQDTFIPYNIVISNSDVKNTYKNLIPDSRGFYPEVYKRSEPSSSVVVFNWGVKGNFPQIDIHNILFSANYKQEFEEIFDKKVYPSDPTIYINISSKYCTSDAPEGCENWFVLVNVPYNQGNLGIKSEVEKLRRIIHDKVRAVLDIDLKDRIVCEDILTPVDIEEKTSSIHGSLYGLSSNSRLTAFFRQQNRSGKYKGLYFVGGSAHPGGGMPLVLLSGKITADLIQKDINMKL